MLKWYLSYSLVQHCLSQERHNVIHVDILKQVAKTIYIEKSLSDERESSTFYANMFNGADCLTCQTLWLLLLLGYKRVSKPCATNVHSGYSNLFSSWFSKSQSLFAQSGLDLEEFIVNVIIPELLPFYKKEFVDFGFQIQ